MNCHPPPPPKKNARKNIFLKQGNVIYRGIHTTMKEFQNYIEWKLQCFLPIKLMCLSSNSVYSLKLNNKYTLNCQTYDIVIEKFTCSNNGHTTEII